MLDIWTIPLIIVIFLICAIGIVAARKSSKANVAGSGQDSAIPEMVEDHPFALNPILWILLVATAFIGIVIFYYAASS
ncbi:hypothetical protein FITA111629_03120 [Filibacter tadaridae]|uniref:Uncharacterized protein n=1 Tax=Filibacter tadaridae TaxID=2483811 RepID=A0A3P5XIB8_9BACL|nr:hypothetical protein [Filibacter tadaridae]VDC29917.1 hypothetical protein FILTAD_02469 [Filibacter tadaridae]